MSVVPRELGDRRERWRVYERWRLRKERIVETNRPPAPGWDAHRQPDTYKPPEGEGMPPVEVSRVQFASRFSP